MKNFSVKLLASALFIITFCNSIMADEYAEKLDKLMREFDEIGMFSGTVLLAKDNVPVFEKSYGYADWEKRIPNTTETLFRIGSLNKMFTHSMINQLQNEGKLKLSDPLNKYLDIYPEETGSKITIQMLVEMKAGLGDYLNDPAFNNDRSKFKTVNDFLELIKNEPLLFEPGTSERYSNSGYAVLGGVIEKVTGKSYAENLKERFLDPLGMTNTHYKLIGEKLDNTATGTMITFSGNKINSKMEEQPSPAGGMFSTPRDLLTFDSELRKTGIMSLGIRAGGTQVWNAILAQMKDGYTLIITSNFGKASEEVLARFQKIFKGDPYPAPGITMEMEMYKILTESGPAGLKKNLKQILENNDREYNDMHLNFFGYQLMQSGKLEKAIEVFRLNTELFPEVINVWDSLAEAYMNKGNSQLAIENYKKVLEMDPGNKNAAKMLEKLSK